MICGVCVTSIGHILYGIVNAFCFFKYVFAIFLLKKDVLGVTGWGPIAGQLWTDFRIPFRHRLQSATKATSGLQRSDGVMAECVISYQLAAEVISALETASQGSAMVQSCKRKGKPAL